MNTATKNMWIAGRALMMATLVVGLAACGGGGSGGSSSPPPGGGNNGNTGNNGGNDSAGIKPCPEPAAGAEGFSNCQKAIAVFGQPNFKSWQPNRGSSVPSAKSVRYPEGRVSRHVYKGMGAYVLLPDTFNHRVLGMAAADLHSNPTGTADFVLGQPGFTNGKQHDEKDNSRKTFYAPGTAIATHGKLLVNDSQYNRILIYSSIPGPGSDNPPATIAVGQPDLKSNDHDPAPKDENVDCSSSSLYRPKGMAVTPNGKLVVADSLNNRLLIWNSIPTENGAPADIVLGQPNFTSCNPNNGQDRKDPGATRRNVMFRPQGVWTNGTKLVVADSGNNRVLIWNTFPTSNNDKPDIVLGQKDFTSSSPSTQANCLPAQPPTSQTLFHPYGVYSNDGKMLFVADQGNNRVLIWRTFPTENAESADVVLGQIDFKHYKPNRGRQANTKQRVIPDLPGRRVISEACIAQYSNAPTAHTLNLPTGVFYHAPYLYVTDYANNRYLVYKAQ